MTYGEIFAISGNILRLLFIFSLIFGGKGLTGMFLGEYSHTVDAKGRVFMPAKFREQLSDNFVVARSVDACLAVYPPERWYRMTEKIKALPEIKAKKIARFLFPSALEAAPDAQGRFLLTQNLREYANLQKNVCIIGMGDYVEIWDENALSDERCTETPEEIRGIMQELDF